MLARHEPQVLRPFHRSEVQSVAEAAEMAGRSERTIRDWCARFDIGRRIGGRWAVSKVALAMLLDGNKDALVSYLAGDRCSSTVAEYFSRCGVPLPKQIKGRLMTLSIPVPRRRIIGTKGAEGCDV